MWLTFALNGACIDSTIILCTICDDVGFIPVNPRLVIANTPNLTGSHLNLSIIRNFYKYLRPSHCDNKLKV